MTFLTRVKRMRNRRELGRRGPATTSPTTAAVFWQLSAPKLLLLLLLLLLLHLVLFTPMEIGIACMRRVPLARTGTTTALGVGRRCHVAIISLHGDFKCLESAQPDDGRRWPRWSRLPSSFSWINSEWIKINN